MSYKIGSFNCHNMGRNCSDEKILKISQIINGEKFDIVALQEVFSSENAENQGHVITATSGDFPVSAIIRNLEGGKWKGYFCAPKQARDAKEGYAFLWNENRVHLPKVRLENGIERVYYPRIFNQYKKNDQKIHLPITAEEKYKDAILRTELVRNPLYARFIPNGQPKMELRIINTHIRFSKNAGTNSDNTDNVSLPDRLLRIKEFNVIAKTIYPKAADKIYGKEDSGGVGSFYTIMIGDYNLNLNRNWTKSPYVLEEVFEINDNGKIKKMQTFQDGLTTIRRISEENEEEFKNQQKYINNYDHVTFDVNQFTGKGLKTSVSKVDAVRKYNNNDFVNYRKNISDHIPIYLEFDNNAN